MTVIRNGDNHRIDLAMHLIKHHSIVLEAFSLRIFGAIFSRARVINIADRDIIFTEAAIEGDIGNAAPTNKS